MFQKLIRKFRISSEGSKSSPHSLPLNYSAYDIDAKTLNDDASFYSTPSFDDKHSRLFENPNVPIEAEMLEEDNMAWVSTKSRQDPPKPPYTHPASYYTLPDSQPKPHYKKRAEMLEEDNMAWGSTKKSRKVRPSSQQVERAEMLEEDNIAWGRLPMGRKMRPASHYVEHAELLEEDNRAW